MYYNSNRNDNQLLELKQRCIDNPSYKVPYEHLAIAAEWKSSLTLGLSYKTRLTDLQRDFEIFNRIDELHRYHLVYLKDYYDSRERLLSSFGAAVFYLDETLSAYNKGGDPRLLNKLKEKGIRIGTNFSKSNVGVFVANIAQTSPFETYCRAGQENFLRIFSDYICFARHVAISGRRFRSINLIFLPKEVYCQPVHDSINFILETEDISAKADFIYPNIAKRITFLERLSRSANDILMLVDDNLDVVFVNELFKKEFGKTLFEQNLEPLERFMPELASNTTVTNSPSRKYTVTLSLTNSHGVEAPYTVYAQHIAGCGHKLCFVPNLPSEQGSGSTKTRYSFGSLIGSSVIFTESLEVARRASQSLGNVLIIGESGTGKELIAQSVHSASPRSNAPFIPVNCSAIPKELINSELMGYEEGAFTGAKRGGKPGKFELAEGGTIFLDEISEMPIDMQCTLLRIIEDRVINRIGSGKYTPVDVRIIAATNKDLWQCVQDGTFRLDLYFRLNVIRIELPALRERFGDIEKLTRHLLAYSSYKNRLPIVKISEPVMELFERYFWPGNVRELKNTIERCVIMSNSDTLTVDTLPKDVLRQLTADDALYSRPSVTTPISAAMPSNEKDKLKGYESRLISDLMTKHNGNKSLVAKAMGISRSTLYKRLSEIEAE